MTPYLEYLLITFLHAANCLKKISVLFFAKISEPVEDELQMRGSDWRGFLLNKSKTFAGRIGVIGNKIRIAAESYSVIDFNVPFCEECTLKHKAELKPVSPRPRIRKTILDEQGRGVGGLVIAGCGIFLASFLSFDNVSQTLVHLGMSLTALQVGGGEHLSVVSLTSMTSAVDFTDLQSKSFEPGWRTFRFRNPEYVQLFKDANRDHLWSASGSAAKIA